MRIVTRLSWVVLIAAVMLSAFAPSVIAQTPVPPQGSEFDILEPFASFYSAMPDPNVMLGYPISPAFYDSTISRMVQYFQRGRLEVAVDENGKEEVLMSRIGAIMYTPGKDRAPVRNSGPTCRSFSTGYNVCYGFLQFYDFYQGATYFGNPISDVELDNGRMVQYFENVRLEWRGEIVNGRHVGLSHLGRMQYDMLYQGRPKPTPSTPQGPFLGPATQATSGGLNVRAFVKHSLLPANGEQTLYIVVQDQSFQPVPNAAISVIVTKPNGLGQQSYRPDDTDANGISVLTFQVGDVPVKEIVSIQVTASLPQQQIEQSTTTWFRIWW
ncbi:MAG TPA: hypothetical protein VIO36_00580 [Anaerolineaceae bacterium]